MTGSRPDFRNILTSARSAPRTIARTLRSRASSHFAYLAGQWEKWYQDRLAHFERIKATSRRNSRAVSGRAYSDSHQQRDACVYAADAERSGHFAQMSAGRLCEPATLGLQAARDVAAGMRLSPGMGPLAAVGFVRQSRARPGLETFIANAGVTHFFVDTHLITGGQPLGTFDNGISSR
jgi:hypothetical protein